MQIKKGIDVVVSTSLIMLLVVAVIAVIGAKVLNTDGKTNYTPKSDSLLENATIFCQNVGYTTAMHKINFDETIYCVKDDYARKLGRVLLNNTYYWDITQ